MNTDESSAAELNRRSFLGRAGAATGDLAAGVALPRVTTAQAGPSEQTSKPGASQGQFWPDGTRLVVSISMQFEAGGQPSKGTDSPLLRAGWVEDRRVRGLQRGLVTNLQSLRRRFVSTVGTRRVFETRKRGGKALPTDLAYL